MEFENGIKTMNMKKEKKGENMKNE